MPIKFRCKHCQQLLGISVSRAGAVVDCPQCGRSLRAPELDGKTKKLPQATQGVKGDAALISALSELSALEHQEITPSTERATKRPAPVAVQAKIPAVVPIPVDAVAVEAITVHDPVAAVGDWVDAPPDFDLQDEPVVITDSLAELAGWDDVSSAGEVNSTLLADMRAADRAEQVASLRTLSFCLAALLIGVGFGWWLRPLWDKPGTTEVENDAARELDAGQPELLGDGRRQIRGSVKFSDAAGTLQPDSGARVLLLPTIRRGTLMFDGKSLRRDSKDPDRLATEAGLSAVGVQVAEADAGGVFNVSLQDGLAYTLIVISSHQARPGDVSIDPAVDKALQQYIESSVHLCGKLAATAKTITDDRSVEDFRIQFRTSL